AQRGRPARGHGAGHRVPGLRRAGAGAAAGPAPGRHQPRAAQRAGRHGGGGRTRPGRAHRGRRGRARLGLRVRPGVASGGGRPGRVEAQGAAAPAGRGVRAGGARKHAAARLGAIDPGLPRPRRAGRRGRAPARPDRTLRRACDGRRPHPGRRAGRGVPGGLRRRRRGHARPGHARGHARQRRRAGAARVRPSARRSAARRRAVGAGLSRAAVRWRVRGGRLAGGGRAAPAHDPPRRGRGPPAARHPLRRLARRRPAVPGAPGLPPAARRLPRWRRGPAGGGTPGSLLSGGGLSRRRQAPDNRARRPRAALPRHKESTMRPRSTAPLLAMLAASTAAVAAPPSSLAVGQEVRGEITSADTINWRDGSRSELYAIQLSADQAVRFQVEGPLRAQLSLFRGEELVQASDAMRENASLVARPQRPGRYVLAVSGADAGAYGPYTLSATPMEVYGGGEIVPGATITDWSQSPRQIPLRISEAGLYRIRMASEDFDTVLGLEGNGYALRSDDADGSNSVLTVRLEPGVYTLVATG